MVQRAPRDEREWRSMVERGIREARAGMRPLVAAAVGGVVDTIDQTAARHPTAPIELTYQTALYIDVSSRHRVRFMLDFPDVTKATDGTDIPISQYELWGKPDGSALLAATTDAVPAMAVPGLTMPGLAGTPANVAAEATVLPWRLLSTSVGSAFRADSFIPSSTWRFRVRAIGTNTVVPGEWSIEVIVQMLADVTPPPQPSPPVLTVQRGTITAAWDGLSVSGAMPADFKYCILAHGTTSSPTTEIARFGRGGGFKVVANIPYYDPQFFRLQAVDESGNHSPWSEQSVDYTTPLVDKDIILSTIDAAKTYLKNINAGVSILPNTIITEHLVVTEEMTAALANFLHVKADMLEANEIWADAAWFGVADAILVRSDMFEGKAFTGGTFTGSIFRTSVEEYSGIKLDADGLRQWDVNGNLTVSLTSNGIDENLLIGDLATSIVGDPGIKIQNHSSWGLPAILYSYDGGIGVEQAASFMRYTITGDPELVHRAPNREIIGGTGLGFVRVEGDLILSLGTPNQQKIRSEAPLHLSAWSPVDGYHSLTIKGKLVNIIADDGDIVLNSGAQYVQAPGIYDKTTGLGANVYISEDGGMFRSTSAAKYKIMPREMDVPASLLDVPMKDWVDLHSAEEFAVLQYEKPRPLSDADEKRLESISLRRIPGAIAEDVVAAGGSQFVVYGNDGEVEGLMYERFALARTALLYQEVLALRVRVSALEKTQNQQ